MFLAATEAVTHAAEAGIAEKATRLMFTALSISSMLIRTRTPLRRASTP